ncbi:MAG TPA: cyclase family protein [Thermotogota bacterium]|nr:cyclase family protein [Thermotogota bacterium]
MENKEEFKPKYVDLTYPIEEGMLTYPVPWHPIVSVTQLGRIGVEGRETRKIELGTHTGTHLDAALHFIKAGYGVDQIPLETLIGPVSIHDFSQLLPGEKIEVKHIENLSITERMIFKFNWGRYWGKKDYYKDFPYISKEAAYLLIEKGLKLIGMDTPSPDGLASDAMEDCPVHKIFLKHSIVIVEYLANLEIINDLEGWELIVLPLNIKGADGSPVRALLKKSEEERARNG